MPFNEDFYVTYPASAPSGEVVVIDTGRWSAFTALGARGITVQHGETIQFRRTSIDTFEVISPASPTPRSGEANFPYTDNRILIVGQSLGQQWIYRPAPSAFVTRRQELGDIASNTFLHWCYGGSAALKEYRTSTDNWWFDLDTATGGPLLDAVNAIVAAMPTAAKPTHILWIHGETDSTEYAGTTTGEDAIFRQRYHDAVEQIIESLRTSIGATVPAYIQILGPRMVGDIYRGMSVLRDAQWDLIGDGTNIHVGAVPPANLPLFDDVHPSAEGYSILGSLTADAF